MQSGCLQWKDQLRKYSEPRGSPAHNPRKTMTGSYFKLRTGGGYTGGNQREGNCRLRLDLPKNFCLYCKQETRGSQTYIAYCCKTKYFLCEECYMKKITFEDGLPLPCCNTIIFKRVFKNPKTIGNEQPDPNCGNCLVEKPIYALPCEHKICKSCYRKNLYVKLIDTETGPERQWWIECQQHEHSLYPIERVHQMARGQSRRLGCVKCRKYMNGKCFRFNCNHYACEQCIKTTLQRCPMCEKDGKAVEVKLAGSEEEFQKALSREVMESGSDNMKAESADSEKCLYHPSKVFAKLSCSVCLCIECIEEMISDKVAFKIHGAELVEEFAICTSLESSAKHVLPVKFLYTVASRKKYLKDPEFPYCMTNSCCRQAFLQTNDCDHACCEECVRRILNEKFFEMPVTELHGNRSFTYCPIDRCRGVIPVDQLNEFFKTHSSKEKEKKQDPCLSGAEQPETVQDCCSQAFTGSDYSHGTPGENAYLTKIRQKKSQENYNSKIEVSNRDKQSTQRISGKDDNDVDMSENTENRTSASISSEENHGTHSHSNPPAKKSQETFSPKTEVSDRDRQSTRSHENTKYTSMSQRTSGKDNNDVDMTENTENKIYKSTLTATISGINHETRECTITASKTSYLKEVPSSRNCSQDRCQREAVVEFRNCSHRMCEDCVKEHISNKQTMIICGSKIGNQRNSRCATKIPTQIVREYIGDRNSNKMDCTSIGHADIVCDNPDCKGTCTTDERNKILPCKHQLCFDCSLQQSNEKNITCQHPSCVKQELHFETLSSRSCSHWICGKKAAVQLAECHHRKCIECLIKMISMAEEKGNTVCDVFEGARFCKTQIPKKILEDLIMENPATYLKEKRYYNGYCSQSICLKKPVVELRVCTHGLCYDCATLKISEGRTMTCGAPDGYISCCKNEIPTEILRKHLQNKGMDWSTTKNTQGVCDNPDCEADYSLRRDVRDVLPCNHKLCIICVSAQKQHEKDVVKCKVPTCESSGNNPEIQEYLETKPEILGIPNIGLTCYASCVLQVLGQTPEFKDMLNKHCPRSKQNHVETLLNDILKNVNVGEERKYVLNWRLMEQLMSTIYKLDKSFRRYQENDCHSFIITLLNVLMKEETEKKKPTESVKKSGKPDGPDTEEPMVAENSVENKMKGCRPKETTAAQRRQEKGSCPTALFETRITSRFTYDTCSHIDDVDDQLFYSLLLPVTEDVDTIDDCLRIFFKQEKFTESALTCRECNLPQTKPTTTIRSLQISKAPRILMVQLARFEEVSYGQGFYKELRKTDHRVKFEMTLQVKENYTVTKKELEYELYGVVLHHGSMHGGHYTSYVKKQNTNRWFYCSDSIVREINPDSVLHRDTFRNAYVLFYSRTP